MFYGKLNIKIKCRSIVVAFATFLLSTILISCARETYPKILALGFVNGGFELSVIDLNANGQGSYITNSKVIAPTSFSYCDLKKEIVYSAPVENGEELILWKTNYDTYALTNGNNEFSSPIWSPDCSSIAFTSNKDVTQVYLLNMDDTTVRPLISDQEVSTEGAFWSPNSEFVVTFLPIVSPENNERKYNIGIVRMERGSLIKQITEPVDFPFSRIAWQANGASFIFSAKKETSFDLYLYGIDSESTTKIMESEMDDRFPVLSPNGEKLVFLQSAANQTSFRVSVFDMVSQSIVSSSDYKENITGLFWLNNEEIVYSIYSPIKNTTSFYLLRADNERESSKLGDWNGRFVNPIIFP